MANVEIRDGAAIQRYAKATGAGTDGDPFVPVYQFNPVTFGALTAASMGNATPVIVTASNGNRCGLVVTNISDTIGYLSVGDGTGLTTTNYLIKIGAGETVELSPPLSQQAIAAICGSAAKNIAYQEAV